MVVVNELKLKGDEQLLGVGEPKFQLILSYENWTIMALQLDAGVKLTNKKLVLIKLIFVITGAKQTGDDVGVIVGVTVLVGVIVGVCVVVIVGVTVDVFVGVIVGV